MKTRSAILLIVALILIDQAIKIYIKTHFYYNEEHKILGLDWFRLYFLENPGMAWGWKLGNGDVAKLILTLFRLAAVIWGIFYLRKIIKQKRPKGFITSVAFVYAGAFGNLLDSLFYGLIFEKSDPVTQNIAGLVRPGDGYGNFMFGNVVDMWYLPIIKTRLPDWMPFWGGENFEFFTPVFNTADVWVTAGVVTMLIFQKRFFKKNQSNA